MTPLAGSGLPPVLFGLRAVVPAPGLAPPALFLARNGA